MNHNSGLGEESQKNHIDCGREGQDSIHEISTHPTTLGTARERARKEDKGTSRMVLDTLFQI